jgi:hypothetical protein
MTQPVFDLDLVEEMKRRTAHLPVAIFTGVWPLLSSRQGNAISGKDDRRGPGTFPRRLSDHAIFALRAND